MALHCPATLLVVRPGDRAAMTALAESLRADNLAEVVSGPGPEDARAAAVVADVLGLPTSTVPGLDDAAIEGLADTHRGLTVLVVADGAQRDRTGPVRLEVGSDGVHVREGESGT